MRSRPIYKRFSLKMSLHALVLFVVISIGYTALSAIYMHQINEVKRNEYFENEQRLITLEKDIIGNHIASILSDLLYLSDTLSVHPLDSDGYATLQQDWRTFSSRKEVYYKIRFIDPKGTEQVRINYSPLGAVIVSQEDLQSKVNRYFFQDTVRLKKGQVYVSAFDLNVENDHVEVPFQPMLRLSMPIFNTADQLKGVLILNYFAKYILYDFNRIAANSLGDVFLLNVDGYWISNPQNPKSEWAFMFEETKDVRFSSEYPEAWTHIRSASEGSFSTEDGFYTFKHIIPKDIYASKLSNLTSRENIVGDGTLIAVSKLPNSGEMGEILDTRLFPHVIHTLKNNLLILLFFLALSFFISSLLNINKSSREKIYHYSLDQMTGVLNRRSGFERLDQIYQASLKNKTDLSLCFADVNGLKEVNDYLGHKSGDELLMTVSDGMKTCIRSCDFIIRLGGDEFLIVFVQVPVAQVETLWARICQYYETINTYENRPYLISVSHGIATLDPQMPLHIDDIIRSADMQMYIEKRKLKESFKVRRDMK